ncbi:hypothetical protein [Fimbriiglobus ruber]|uniref:Uncharacterized protein n=1 Tax=Fimbriiglobus ruber TaxID=1908690 RepID=A0A225DPH4_9BACT|nr:hypothetical protein [Fimbriiglobus ruber]OWK38067.1 hypothetical protein FRUB_07187 [Fimbriiglobus ruber]
MTQEAAQKPPGRNGRLALGVLVGLALGIPAGVLALRLWQGGNEAGAVPNGVVDKQAEAAGQRLYDHFDCLLPGRLTTETIEAKEGGTFTKLEFAGTTYWLLDNHLGYGVPRKQIGIYAPDEDGVFHLSLFAQSWAAGHVEATVDKETGVLELRERANSKLQGQLVLSCNLRTVGTQHSSREK